MTTDQPEQQPPAKTVPPPRLRFKQFEGQEWEERRLGDYLRESRISGSNGAVARKITVKLWGKGVYEKQEAISGSENTKYFRRSAGQFIYSKLDFLNGAFGIVPESLDGFESTTDLPAFDFLPGLDPHLLLEYVSREEFYSKFEGGAMGGRKARRVNPSELLNTSVPLPSLPEQRHIAATLSSLDDLITAHTDKLEALRQHKRGLMQQLFPAEGERVPRLRFPEFVGAGEWEETKLGQYVELISGVHLLPNQYSDSGDLPYFSGPSDFTNDKDAVKKWTDENGNPALAGDILIVVKGSGVGELWRLEIHSVALGRQLMAIRAKNSSAEFIYQFLSTLKNYFGGLGKGNLIPGLSRTDILGIGGKFPTLSEEQQRIADCLSSLDDLITAQADKIAALQEFKRGLMQGLFPSTTAATQEATE